MDPYESLHYPSKPFPTARPDRLELIARCFALSPTPAPRARVLEIGCATAGNLLPAAELFPDAHFVGIDLAASQIAAAQARARAAGIDNVDLRAMDLRDLDDGHGAFDYIIANGVYSWVPDEVKRRLLEVIAARLAPDGVAFVTHNVKPGWYTKAAMRGMMLHHIRAIADPRERVTQARALLGFLLGGARRDDAVWKGQLAQHLEQMSKMPDEAIFYDYLAETNDACFFHELVAELERVGLTYLADASLASMMPNALPPEAVRLIDGLDFLERESYLDFLKNRPFRTSLVVRAGAPIRRRLSPEMLVDLHLASSADAEAGADLDGPAAVLFRTRNAGARVTSPAAKRALVRLRERHPASLSFPELATEHGPAAGQLAAELLQLVLIDLIELWRYPDPFVLEPPERPRVTPLTREMAPLGRVPTLRHETVALDADGVALVALLDGTRDLAALGEALPGKDVPALLQGLARKALLVRPSVLK